MSVVPIKTKLMERTGEIAHPEASADQVLPVVLPASAQVPQRLRSSSLAR